MIELSTTTVVFLARNPSDSASLIADGAEQYVRVYERVRAISKDVVKSKRARVNGHAGVADKVGGKDFRTRPRAVHVRVKSVAR